MVVGAVAAFGSFIVASAGLGFVLNLVHLNILKALPYFSLFKSAILGSVAWLKAKNLGLLLVKVQLGATMVATRLYGIATLGLGKALAFGGAALKVFGGILSFVGKSLLLNPIFLIGAILAGGAYLIYKHWTPIKEFFSALWDKIKVGASVAWEGLKNVFKYSPLGILITSFSKVFNYFGTFWNHTKGLFVNSWEFLKSIFKWTPLGLIVQGFSVVTEYFSSLFATWVGMFSEVINKIGGAISSIKGFFGFGEKESNAKTQENTQFRSLSANQEPSLQFLQPALQASPMQEAQNLALQPAQITPIEIKPIPQNPKAQAQNISVAFTGGIQVQTTDGKIPENSQLQRDIQREVEAALKKSQDSQRNRTLSDIDF